MKNGNALSYLKGHPSADRLLLVRFLRISDACPIFAFRGQIKDAVTASMKQWLLEIRNVSAQVGALALEGMDMRIRKWRSRREKDPLLRMSKVGSAVEMVTYEKTECKCAI